ncbi:MnhB domain-containing protein [[Clostridium] leptum]|nr:MnhB domain-containing protein [[Clostridium] leptum]
MDQLVLIFSVAIIVEALVEYTKSVVYMFTRGCIKCGIIRICAAAIGILLALLTGVDLFSQFNIPISQPWIGSVLTGIIISRGSNYLNDIISRLTSPTSAVSSAKGEEVSNSDDSISSSVQESTSSSLASAASVQPAATFVNPSFSASSTPTVQLSSQDSPRDLDVTDNESNQSVPLGPDDFPEAVEAVDNDHQTVFQTDSQADSNEDDSLGISGID